MCSDLQHLPWMHAQNYLAIPDEFSVTGYNDSIMAVSCEPELTSVDNKLKLLCQTTVQHMIALLEKQEEQRYAKGEYWEWRSYIFDMEPWEVPRRRTP